MPLGSSGQAQMNDENPPAMPLMQAVRISLFRRHVGMFRGDGLLGRLPLWIGPRGRHRGPCWRACRARFCELLGIHLRCTRMGCRWSFFADRLPIVVPHHHDDVFGLFSRDDLTGYLRPFAIAALIVADETGIGAMFAYDADLGLFR